jgi:AraC-like DNA-binding protein
MSPVSLTGLARIPRLLLKHAEEQGLDRAEVMATTGITDANISDPDSRIPLIKTWNLWRVLIDRLPDELLGLHLGSSVDVRYFGLVGYVMYYSPTLSDGLHRLARYAHIVSEAAQFDFKMDDRRGFLTFDNNLRFVELRHPVDAAMAMIIRAARDLTGTEVVPTEVRFPYPGPDDLYEYKQFFRSPLEFGRARAVLILDKEDLLRPVMAADETLIKYLDTLAEDVLDTLAEKGTFSDKVRRAVWTELSNGPPSLKSTASALGVSVRTLQRRLREEKTSFAEVVETMRRTLALKLLRDRNLAVYEVAFLLGYSEPSTFYRAFRRWEATSPHEYRRSIA